MRLKYFLRGVGIGLIVSTLIFLIAGYSPKMTDEEIIAKAQILMAEESTIFPASNGEIISSAPGKETETTTEHVTEPTTEAPTEPVTEPATEAPTEPVTEPTTEPTTEGVTESATKGPAPNPDKDETVTNASNATNATSAPQTSDGVTYYSLQIVAGMSSNRVADALYNNGIISDSRAFDDYLIANGYANIIRIGTFNLDSTMTFSQIAQIITGR